jgi:hypothetical protein
MTSTSEKKMSPIQNMALDLLEQTKKVTKDLEKEYEQFLIEKKKFEDEQEALSEKYKINESVIELNVGGVFFTTLKSTLLRAEGKQKTKLKNKEQCLEQCFQEGFPIQEINKNRYDPGPKDIQGRYFLDRPPKPFGKILDVLRTGNKVK